MTTGLPARIRAAPGRGLLAEPAGIDLFELRGALPSGWIDLDFEVSTGGEVLRVPRLLADRGDGVHEPIALPFPRDGRMRGLVRLPDRVAGLRLEVSATGGLQIGKLRVREISSPEVALRLAVPFLRKRLGEPQVLPLMALKLVRALRNGGVGEVLDTLLRKNPQISRLPYGEWVARYATLTDDDRAAIRRSIAKMPSKPRFSVLMPVYETPEPFLRRAIESVRAQLYPDWELCIADDASPSAHVRRILEEAAQADGRIKLTFRTQNGHI